MFLFLLGKKPKPFLPITAPSKTFTLFPIIVFFIIFTYMRIYKHVYTHVYIFLNKRCGSIQIHMHMQAPQSSQKFPRRPRLPRLLPNLIPRFPPRLPLPQYTAANPPSRTL